MLLASILGAGYESTLSGHVAHLDRAPASEAGGSGFESRRAHSAHGDRCKVAMVPTVSVGRSWILSASSWDKMAEMSRPSSLSSSDAIRRNQTRTLIEDRNDSDDSIRGTRLWLTVVEKTEARLLPMPESGFLRIGRAEDSDIVLSSPSVSRNHAVLAVMGDAVSIRDNGSANGTRVGGKRIPPNGEEPVSPGVALLIGGVSLVVHKLGGAASTESLDQGGQRWDQAGVLAGEHIEALRSGARAASESPSGGAQAPGLVIQSVAMVKLFQLVDRIAPGTIPVLLLGETGVGKEVVAAAIHERSPRKGKPYLRLNCSAFAENLLESELFGFEAGAFSGARVAKPGLFETANGGTVLLDEIGEMPLAIQAKLLRAIETREVIPLGGTRVRKLDVRFLSATNRDLGRRITQGLFREDLYFRLSGVTVVVPPLRERASEIAPMAKQFAAEAAAALGRAATPTLSREALVFLERQPWPGNVRELRNCVERAVLLSATDTLSEDDVDPNRDRCAEGNTRKTQEVASQAVAKIGGSSSESAEREQIEDALAACAGNQTRAAALLGVARRTLVRKLAEMGLPRPRRRAKTI